MEADAENTSAMLELILKSFSTHKKKAKSTEKPSQGHTASDLKNKS